VARERLGAASLGGGAALVLFSSVSAVVLIATSAGCSGTGASGPPEIRLSQPRESAPAAIEVVNLTDETARALAARQLTREQWTEILRVSVGDGQPAMLGDYAVSGNTLRFTPMFPLDAGRQYRAVFNAAAAGDGASAAPLVATVGLAANNLAPSTVVSHVFPSTDLVPANQLRLYVHFSAPMGRSGGLPYIRLVDEQGAEVIDPFLPLDAEFWNDDHTRYTVFFDPGRQKRGILPNQQMGRSLEPGRRYTLVVSREWRDGNGLPLREDFRRDFLVGEPDERPLDTAGWRIAAPRAGTREPVVVSFDESLDHGLLLRALGVTGGDARFLPGDVKIEAAEARWSFTPRAAWTAGTYQLTALAMLEDLAGNRIGRAFEVDTFTRVDSSPEPERTSIPFAVR
jgi:hypothetical protein